MAEHIPPELIFNPRIWWDPIWPLVEKAGLAGQPEILAAALDAQAQIHTVQAAALQQMKAHVLKGKSKG